MKKIILIIFTLFLSLQAYGQTGKYIIWTTTTCSYSAVDTASRQSATSVTSLNNKFPNSYAGSIYSDSTLDISTSVSFSAGLTFVTTPGKLFPIFTMDAAAFPELYIRNHYSGGSTITYTLILRGY